jgi:hypothetical protein
MMTPAKNARTVGPITIGVITEYSAWDFNSEADNVEK